MPELPEVETVCRGLKEVLFEKKAKSIEVERSQVLSPKLRSEIPKKLGRLKGHQLLKLERRAKYLLFYFEKGLLLNHLGMTGSWRVDDDVDRDHHDHFSLRFTNGLQIVYRDPRRFGVLDWLPMNHNDQRLFRLGPEPLESSFSAAYLYEKLRGKKLAVKAAIMDQAIVVGVGNIYASEALFRVGVRPGRSAGRVSLSECERLVEEIRIVLEEAIQAGGSTISDFRQAGGSEGYFQHRFKVYGRAGEECMVCGVPIKQKVIGQRSSFYCPVCQPK